MEDAHSFIKEKDSPESSLAPAVSSPKEEDNNGTLHEAGASRQTLDGEDQKDNLSSLSESDLTNLLETNGDDSPAMDHKEEPKIVARLSPEDDHNTTRVSFPRVRSGSVAHLIAKIPSDYIQGQKLNDRSKSVDFDLARGQIDTDAPFESVKAAVSKFGGIVDWKAHRVHTVERRKVIDQELEKAQEEIPLYKQRAGEAEEAKAQVLRDLDGTKRVVEELKLNLERAQTEEQQAKQDFELAKLRVEELEQGIADEASFAAKAQLEVAKARHMAALSELKTVHDELEQLKKDYNVLVSEKVLAVIRAEEAASASKEVEKSVEELTIELIAAKQSLESAHAVHMEAEEHRIGAIVAKEQDVLDWEKEIKNAEEELKKLNEQVVSTKDLKSKLHEATMLLRDLKAELASYMLNGEEDQMSDDIVPDSKTHGDIETAIASAKNELEQVKLRIEKAMKEVEIFKAESASLKSELEKEKSELEVVQQREEMASVTVASLESEIINTKSEISLIQMRDEEERERLVELPKQLQEAAKAADQAKALAQIARDELKKAKEEVEQAKAGANTIESKLRAAQKEIEAAKASEKLALAAINALEESESAQEHDGDGDGNDSSKSVTLTLEEYYKLSKRAHEAEEEANARVVSAVEQIEVAKATELKTLNKLEEVMRDMSERKNVLEDANQKAEAAQEGKLVVERELRSRRAENEQRGKDEESVPLTVNLSKSPRASFETHDSSMNLHHRVSPRAYMNGNKETETGSTAEAKVTKKKKKFFPRFFMFLGRKKTQSSKMA